MSIDANILIALSKELDDRLRGGRVDKIYQMSKSDILMTIRSLGENYRLLVSSNASEGRICITDQVFENPDTPPVFCMLMRKHLSGGKIVSIKTIPNDRIIKIEIENTNELFELKNKTLILEIMGKHSNIILIDESNRIIDSIKHIDFTTSEKRQVLPGLYYEEPPKQNKKDANLLSNIEILDSLNSDHDDVATSLMTNFLSISPILAREIAYLSNNDKINASIIYKNFLKKIKNNEFAPTMLVSKDTSEPKAFYIFDICQYGDLYYKITFESINECVNSFYRKKDEKKKINEKKDELYKVISKNLSRINKKIDIHKKNISKAEKKDKYRIYAELITANLYKLKENCKEALLENYYDENKILTIPMDETISPARNAKRYFEKYNKEKTMKKISTKILLTLDEETSYLISVRDMIDLATDETTIAEIKDELISSSYIEEKKGKLKKKKPKLSEPLEFISSDNYTILCGRNNRQNDELTFKIANKFDLWLHIRNIPGCHTVIQSKNEEIPEQTLLEAALLATHFSKSSNDTKASVDYTQIRYVKKPSGAKPGMVIYDNFKTIIVEPNKDIINILRK